MCLLDIEGLLFGLSCLRFTHFSPNKLCVCKVFWLNFYSGSILFFLSDLQELLILFEEVSSKRPKKSTRNITAPIIFLL